MTSGSGTRVLARNESDAGGETRELSLRQGRTLTVTSAGEDELVEVRAASGVLELRVKLTDQGVVLQLEGARISLKAAESVDVECQTFNVSAERSVALTSQGGVSVEADGDVRVQGEMIYLN